jgi:hypothetical protein
MTLKPFKKPKKEKTNFVKAPKTRWCQCAHPKFNGDNIDPTCTTCGGQID